MPDMFRMFEEIHEALDRREWLLKIQRMEIECGIDPWYGEFSEWIRELTIPGYKKTVILNHYYKPFKTEKVYR